MKAPFALPDPRPGPAGDDLSNIIGPNELRLLLAEPVVHSFADSSVYRFTPSTLAVPSLFKCGDALSSPEAYGHQMAEAEKPLREQMTDAMDAISKQLDLLRSGPSIGGPSDDRSLIADLEAEFEELKEARSNL